MGPRVSIYRLHYLSAMDDALIGGRRTGGKRGRGAGGKTPVLVAIENRDKRARLHCHATGVWRYAGVC